MATMLVPRPVDRMGGLIDGWMGGWVDRNASCPLFSATKNFNCSALKDWNNTSINRLALPTTNTFKRQLKLYLRSET